VDVYRYKNATWLIFTDETRWVVELTDEGTLWYNYKFFNDVFKYVSMTVGKEMEEYVIQWANDYFFKVSTLRSIANNPEKDRSYTEKVLNFGIKETGDEFERHTRAVIDNGVKEILNSMTLEPKPKFVEDVINQGIKEVYDSSSTHRQMRAQNLIPRIVKDVKPHRVVVPAQGMDRFYYDPGCSANTTDIFRIVEEGIKNTRPSKATSKSGIHFDDVMCSGNTTDINIIVENGVKKIYPDRMSGDEGYNWSNEFEADKVIERGIKL
jgi:hypothetical protein